MENNDQAQLNKFAEELHSLKYRSEGETFRESMARMAGALSTSEDHFYQLYEVLRHQRFMGGGRTQQSLGSPTQTTAYNCAVSGDIEDSFSSIMEILTQAGESLRKGSGVGYDFSKIRPKGTNISSLGSASSGPISFMALFDALCQTVSSAGHRRGAQMGVLRVDHPNIEDYIRAKHNSDKLTAFNLSIAITDKFMQAVVDDTTFDLVWEGKTYKTVQAKALYELIMRSTHSWSEPGFLFIDRINDANNLNYIETISASNPCGEQPLPPNGVCLLGSFNLTKYVVKDESDSGEVYFSFNYDLLKRDIPIVVRAMDQVVEQGNFPLPEQEEEGLSKRRMGLGVTGVANAVEACAGPYGSPEFLSMYEGIAELMRDEVYLASSLLAKEFGSFPAYDKELYSKGEFYNTLPDFVKESIQENGLRNSHLLSIAPCGTISLCANNVSGGIEPVFSLGYTRTVQTVDGPTYEDVVDYGYKEFGVKGKIAADCTPDEHLAVLALATKYVDSAVSKTINVSADIKWDDFKDIYIKAWRLGCKGVTTFNPGGERFGILNETAKEEPSAQACYVDPETGHRSCG